MTLQWFRIITFISGMGAGIAVTGTNAFVTFLLVAGSVFISGMAQAACQKYLAERSRS